MYTLGYTYIYLCLIGSDCVCMCMYVYETFREIVGNDSFKVLF